MKKIFFTLALGFSLISSVQAQYYQNKYRSSNFAYKMGDGITTKTGMIGNFMVGYHEFGPSLLIQYTDIIATATIPPFFNKELFFNNANIQRFTSVKTEQTANGDFAVIASYIHSNPGLSGVLILIIDPAGNIIFSETYNQSLYNREYIVTDVAASKVPGQAFMYISGYTTNFHSSETQSFVIKILDSGPVQWFRVYQIGSVFSNNFAYGITDSPGRNPLNNYTELVVVGRYESPGNSPSGFILPLDNLGGFPSGLVYLHGSFTPGIEQHFTAIEVSLNPGINPGPFNYVLSGDYVNLNTGNNSFWFSAMNMSFSTPIWSHLYPMNDIAKTNDLVERFNPYTLQYEYYIVGTSSEFPGTFDNDITVIKTDNAGVGVPNGKFIYPDPGYNEGLSIDLSINGLHTFGQAGPDHYVIRSYYNGVAPCVYNLYDPIHEQGPETYTDAVAVVIEDIMTYNLFYDLTVVSGEEDICFAPSVDGGENTLKIPKKENKGILNAETSTMSPNPSPEGIQQLHIDLEGGSKKVSEIEVTIVDMLGRVCYQGTAFSSGASGFNIAHNGLKTGTYIIRIRSENGLHNKTLLVK